MIVAQLVRASDCGSEGRGFETHHSPLSKGSVSKDAEPFLFFPPADSEHSDASSVFLLLHISGEGKRINDHFFCNRRGM